MLHIRALVKSDAVILFDHYGSVDTKLHSAFLYHLEVCRLKFSTTYTRMYAYLSRSTT